jgi:hypothetical protein
VDFSGDTIGKVTVNVSKGGLAGAQAQAVNVASFSAAKTLGAINLGGDATMTQASELRLFAGGTISGVKIAAKTAALGSLIKGSILAGQNVDLAAMESAAVLNRRLAASSLGAVSIGGSLGSSIIAAGGNIAQITIGQNVQESLILGGALLGEDGVVGGDNDRFIRGAQMAGVTVKGALGRSTISNGVQSVNNVIGDGDDVAAPAFEGFEIISAIKSITIGSGLAASPTPAETAHAFAFQAGTIGKLTLGKTKFTDFAISMLLDAAPVGEGGDDIVVRVFPG